VRIVATPTVVTTARTNTPVASATISYDPTPADARQTASTRVDP
jgi:hypothetical protein